MLRRKNKKSPYLLTLLLALLLTFVGYGVYHMTFRALKLAEDKKSIEAEIAELSLKKGWLESRLAALKTKEVVLREAKGRLNLKLPGEEVVVVLPGKSLNEQAPVESLSFFKKIMEIIKSLFR